MLLITQNKKLAKEIQMLMNRDADSRNILERDNHLKDVRLENDRIVNNSHDKVQDIIDGPRRTSIKRTYSADKNENKNGKDPGIISSMNLSESGKDLQNSKIEIQEEEKEKIEQNQGEEQDNK